MLAKFKAFKQAVTGNKARTILVSFFVTIIVLEIVNLAYNVLFTRSVEVRYVTVPEVHTFTPPPVQPRPPVATITPPAPPMVVVPPPPPQTAGTAESPSDSSASATATNTNNIYIKMHQQTVVGE